jgi:hypothetical protein
MDYSNGQQINTLTFGPAIYSLRQIDMRPHSLIVQSSKECLGKIGDLSLTLQRPGNASIAYSLMVRQV